MTALHGVAEQVGTNRILVAGKFHHPFGRPELPRDKEFQWRKQVVKSALNLLARPVEAPTVFYAEEENL